MKCSTSKLLNGWDTFEKCLFTPLTTGTLHLFRDRRKITCRFEVNLSAFEANLKQTENCKGNKFIKNDQKIS